MLSNTLFTILVIHSTFYYNNELHYFIMSNVYKLSQSYILANRSQYCTLFLDTLNKMLESQVSELFYVFVYI